MQCNSKEGGGGDKWRGGFEHAALPPLRRPPFASLRQYAQISFQIVDLLT
jgi:hypothetical protein